MRLLVVQTGDYGEAWARLRDGGAETFRDQGASVSYMERLSSHSEVTILARCGRVHDERLSDHLRSIGVDRSTFDDRRAVSRIVDEVNPTLAIITTPHLPSLSLLGRRPVRVLPMFADTFANRGFKSSLRNWQLGRLIRALRTPCVANHSLEASRSLLHLGFDPSVIVPWEHFPLPVERNPKAAPANGSMRVLYVGRLSEPKGLGDAIEAVAMARRRSVNVTLTVIGSGDFTPFLQYATKLGVASSVEYKGVQPNALVRRAMREHDVVIVPSRHEYPEGLPNTIAESLAARTPLIASDHPAFSQRLDPDKTCLQFRAGSARALSEQITRLGADPELYAALSENGPSALIALHCGVDWETLLNCYLNDPSNSGEWVSRFSLARTAWRND